MNYARLDASTLNIKIREIGIYDQESSIHDSNDVSMNHHMLLEPSERGISADEEII